MDNIRNFVIIAHIDHGKSTLADRFLELTGTVEKRKMQEQFLDIHPLERERGITIKLQPVRMDYTLNSIPYTLNLIDTPGHVDFYYEVSRSLAAVEGAILLVDAAKGIQAQTLSNYDFAKKQNLKIISVINKIDLPNAQVEKTEQEISNLMGINKSEILKISAKNGIGVEDVLKAVIEKIPPPLPSVALAKEGLQALIFDSKFDTYKGIIAYVRVFNGSVKSGDKIYFFAQKADSEALEVGFFKPHLLKADKLSTGEIGYIATGLKDISKVRVGDTIILATRDKRQETSSLPGYQEPNPVVFASLYPRNTDDYRDLKDSLEKLRLQDSSLKFEPEHSDALGPGFRCGFLGMLHAEIVSEKLKRDYGLDLIITSPSVEYEVKFKNPADAKALAGRQNSTVKIMSASKLPDPSKIESISEPVVELEILAPAQYLGQVMKLLAEYRSTYIDTQYLSTETVILKYRVPLAEIIVDFYDKLKSSTRGYASMSYKFAGFQNSDLVRLDVLVGGELVEPFSRIVPEEKAQDEGKRMVEKLKQIMPPQLFNLALQAAIGGKIIARETITARRKDVTGYLYGGDVTRKMKLLEKQKKGKEKLKERSKVEIPQKVFLEMLK